MRGRSLVIFIILNIIISIGVALGVISFLGSPGGDEQIIPITVQIVVTPTPDPDGDATRIAFAVEQTIDAQSALRRTQAPEVDLPEDILDDLQSNATIDPDVLAANPAAASTASALPDGCILHEIGEGDTPFGVAEQYGVSGPAVMNVNGLTEERATQLQIGDILIVPLPNCPIEELLPRATATLEATETEEVTETPTNTASPSGAASAATSGETTTPTSTPTITLTPTSTLSLAPTAVNAQVEIVEFLSPGDITAEGVSIINRGSVVDVTGWTLTDAQGNEFVFPEQRLFTNGSVTIYTRAGEDTPVVLYWGRSTAVWGDDEDVATLTDAAGRVQSSVLVP